MDCASTPQAGRNWRVVNRFLLSSSGDLDHVAVGPAGLLVIETKWSAYPWQSRDGAERVQAAVGQVQRVTRQLRLWTEVKKSSVHVSPVVVLWGGGGWDETNRVQYVDGVAVVEGNVFRAWARALDPDPAALRPPPKRSGTPSTSRRGAGTSTIPRAPSSLCRSMTSLPGWRS